MVRPIRMALALAAVVGAAAGPGAHRAWADTVELRNGQRVQGKFREAIGTAVVIESGGQMLTFDRAQVSAIYLDAAPPPPPTRLSPARGDTLQALDALRALTQVASVKQSDYARRVAGAKVALDRYLQEPLGGDVDLRALIADAWGLYAVASAAWEAKATHNAVISIAVGQDPVLDRCVALQPVLAKYPPPTSQGAALRRGVAVEAQISTLWSCAADKLAEAELLAR